MITTAQSVSLSQAVSTNEKSDDTPVGGVDDLRRLLIRWPSDRPVALTILRHGRERRVDVVPIEG